LITKVYSYCFPEPFEPVKILISYSYFLKLPTKPAIEVTNIAFLVKTSESFNEYLLFMEKVVVSKVLFILAFIIASKLNEHFEATNCHSKPF